MQKSDVTYIEPSAGNIQPYIPLAVGESLRKTRSGWISDRYFLGFAPDGLNKILIEGPPSVARLFLWAATHLVLGTNLVGSLPMSHHSPKPTLATVETMAADLGRSPSSIRRDLSAANDMDIWAPLSHNGKTHFLVNPRLAWRGDTNLRNTVIAFYDQLRHDPTQSTLDNVVSILARQRQK